MKGAIGNAFIMNLVITFIIIFFMLLIGSIAYSKSYKVNKYLMDSLMDYVDYFNEKDNQKDICFTDGCKAKVTKTWSSRVNEYLMRSGYFLSNENNTCPSYSSQGYNIVKNTRVGDYEYCIYQRMYYELNEKDDIMSKKRYSYKVLSYMKLDLPIIGQFIKLPIVSESKVVLNFH